MFPFGIASRGSFKRQIILTYVVGIFVLVSAFAAYTVNTEREALYRNSRMMASGLAQSLAVSALPWVMSNDVVGLQEAVQSFQIYPELRYVMVISPAGRVLAHSDTSKVGQYLSDEQSLLLLKASPANRVLTDNTSLLDVVVPVEINGRHVGWARAGLGREGIARDLQAMVVSYTLFVLAATALSLLAALLIANRLGYRIGILMKVAEQVQGGNFATRAKLPGTKDEIATLADSLNQMLDVLSRNAMELRMASLYTRSLIEASLDPMVTISAQGKITDVNHATEQITGCSREELIGTDFSEYFTEPDKARAVYRQVFDQSHVTDYPLALRHRDGYVADVLYNASVYRDETGQALGVLAAARNISELKRTEMALRENERFLDAIVEHIPNMLFVKDAVELRFLRFNKAGEELLGYSRGDLIGKSDRDFFPQEQADFFIAKDRQIIASGEMLDIAEEPIDTKNRGQRYLHTRKIPIYDNDGSPLYLLGISEDITERKRDVEQLQRSEQSLAEAQRIAQLGNWELDLTTNALHWSDEIYRIFEIDREKFGASYDAFLNAIHPDDRERVNKAYTDSVANKTPYEIGHRLLMPDGRIKYVNEKCETHYDAEGKPLRSIGTVHDITARKRTEDELLEREKHSQSLLSLSRKLERSQTYAEVLNAARDEVRSVIGYQNLWAYLLSEDKQSARALMAGGPISDAVMSDESVSTLPVKGDRMMEEIAAAKEIIVVEDAQTDARVNREIVAKLGNRSIVNVPIIFYDRHLGSVGMGTFGAEGVRIPSVSEKKYLMALASHIAAALDRIHLLIERAKVEAEVKDLNRDLEQRVGERTAQLEAANKELEAFSYSVSHDLRTPLRAIDGFSHILLEDFSDKLDAEGQRLLNVVRDNTQRMGQLIDDILKFSRTGRVEMNAVGIDMERQAREVFAELLPGDDHGKLQFEIEAIPPFTGDSAMMRQVFVNLLSNAVKFSRAKEHPAIKVGAYIEGNEAVYYVKDNGAGFDMQYAGKLFGVFQRLHSMEEFEGTGIGLAIVKRIITRHGGRVWAEGKVGEGATFYFALPV